jgi:3-deoxy-manno-octulosonate cytidylyltransferase (CMP-KDO synthetase)
MSFRVVIPARFSSERLPGKPLADIHGKPMIVRVAEAAATSTAEEVVVATDDERILAAVEGAGFAAQMTRADHASGTDRVMEVAHARGWQEDDLVLNVQGDEPLIPPGVLDQLAEVLAGQPTVASATLCEPIATFAELADPNLVKVVRAADQRALYFSRAPIPYARDHFSGSRQGPLPGEGQWWRHIGVYGYRCWALRKFVSLPLAKLEALERLEQLRMLENGLDMLVLEACEAVPGGIDTPEDLQRVRDQLQP